jgi:hypothetical protein
VTDGSAVGRSGRVAVALVCAAAFALRLAVALSFPNVLWPDEIHQTLEQARRLVSGFGVVPWEFRDGARSWLLPVALAGPMAIGLPLGGLADVRAAQAALALLSLGPVVVAFAIAARAGGRVAGLVAAACAATWCELIFFAPKALSEAVAASLLVLGLHLDASAASARRRVAGGVLLGAALAVRVQLAPAILVAVAVTAGRDGRRWRQLAAGGALAVTLAGLLDLATWGSPFHSYVTYVRANVVGPWAVPYGRAPWPAYLAAIQETWGWAVAVIVPLAALGARRRPELAACALSVLATHSALAHKQVRFVFPAIVLAIVLAAVGAAEVFTWIVARSAGRLRPAWVAATLVLAWAGTSAQRAGVYLTTEIDPGSTPGTSRWTHAAWGPEAMALARERPDLCGLGILGVHWGWTGGYAYLGRDVPIFLLDDPTDRERAQGGFNAVIAPGGVLPLLPGFSPVRCWPEGACLATRPGGCRAVVADAINAALVRRGE